MLTASVIVCCPWESLPLPRAKPAGGHAKVAAKMPAQNVLVSKTAAKRDVGHIIVGIAQFPAGGN